jgi:L-ascorbate metabolism protein UlaG (beta-lactamase superfamily)
MVINYYGRQFFKITLGDLVIAFDPLGKDSSFKGPRFGADLVLSSLDNEDMNGIAQVSYAGKEPYAITGPGEYEIKDVFIKGFSTPSQYGGKEALNTAYVIKLEDTNLLFLGAHAGTDLPAALKEELEEVDILFLPVGGEGTLSAAEASKLATKLEAHVIIPMTYNSESLKTFLKEEGAEAVKPIDKLVIKKKEILEKDGELVILSHDA